MTAAVVSTKRRRFSSLSRSTASILLRSVMSNKTPILCTPRPPTTLTVDPFANTQRSLPSPKLGAKLAFKRRVGFLGALDFGYDSHSVIRMNARKYVARPDGFIRTDTELRTQHRVNPDIVSFEIARPQAQPTRAGRHFQQFLAIPKLFFGPAPA